MKVTSFNSIRRAKQLVIDSIVDNYRTALFGEPPKSNGSGKLVGGSPPDLSLISRLFKN